MPARKKHIVITTNIYRKNETKNGFDHPIPNNQLHKELYKNLPESISQQQIPKNTTLSWHIIISGTSPVNPASIDRLKEYATLENKEIDLKIFTFENAKHLHKLNPALFNFNQYSGIRNTACAFAYKDKADLLIKIDADEELPKDYLETVLSTLDKYKKIKALGGFYLEEGRRLSPLQDPLESWPKYSAMNVDATQIIGDNKVAESFFAKGGNMILTRPFFSNISHPTVIPRGEDFSFILRAWLIYYNGNPKAGLKPKNSTFKFFVNPSRKMAIIHHTKHAAIRNFLQYTENNLIRFAYETNTIQNQKGLSPKNLINKSTYIGKVIYLPNFTTVVNTIFKELHRKTRKGTSKLTNPVTVALRASHNLQNGYPTYTKKQIEASRLKVLNLWRKIQSKNYFVHYQKEQVAYIKALESLKETPFSFYS